MRYSSIGRILGVLLMLFSVTHLPPLLVDLHYAEHSWQPFALSFLVTLLTGFALWWPCRQHKQDLRIRDGYLVTALFWIVLGSFGALPFALSDAPHMGLVDSLFESFSGLSTTGATVLTGLDALPHAILYYRQQLQWLGGMGIVVLAVAVMPMLGIGGMQLYRAEMPGPLKDHKLSPRIADTAKTLWLIYCSLTLACALAYWAAGMSLFDAVGHSFSTIAIGGFSTHDASIGYFDSPLIELICMTFLVISGINFSLHFLAWRQRKISHYLKDPECRAYLGILLVLFLITAATLILKHHYDSPLQAIRYAAFMVISVATTTGFGLADFSTWPTLLPYLLIYSTFIGACAGSTGGGMKVMRMLLVYRQGMREFLRLLHPNGVFLVKLGRRTVSDRVVESVWAFFSIYLLTFVTLMLVLLALGVDQLTAFSTLASCLNNLGPALGEAAVHYGHLPGSAKLVLSLAMVLGRLEVFSLLILLTPAFWRT
ncbi:MULTISPECIES: TrkH family potassium uptake protein [Pseudomonas]|uniref:TrkH family potassium uptake protein n=1 Tax=Pseudomonas nitroreducens TaxID=46680 RepID=UPI001E613BE1|nr:MULTISPECIES: TrkH family potassium uptake protein [Pseudomonas]MCE4067867.1 TrkH family potassium uptake protein [Pseudomonas nitritireducens]MCE4077056.1 TrkH family potassium uptake protein [Pseudomonas nitroreducens]